MASVEGKLLLLVEDEAILALSEKLSLERYGYRVLLASSGEEAVERFREEPGIDLVLMDVDLGRGMDGTEAAALILGLRRLPLVFLSSHTERELVERTEAISSFGYVVKNSGPTILDASVKMAFKLFEAEEALRRQNTLMRAVMENAPIGFAVNTISDGRGFLISARFEEIYGVARGALSGVGDFFDRVYVDPEQREAMRARILADMASGEPGRMRWEDIPLSTREGGEFRVVTALNIPVIEHDLMVSTVQDVTQRWLSERALRESEERFRGYVENASDIVYELSPEGIFRYVSPNWEEYVGEPASVPVGRSFEPYVHPEDLGACRAFLARVIGGDARPGSVDYRVRRADGSWLWMSSRGAALRDKEGRIVAYLGIGRDVSERRRGPDRG